MKNRRGKATKKTQLLLADCREQYERQQAAADFWWGGNNPGGYGHQPGSLEPPKK